MKVRARHLVFGACLSTAVLAAATSGWACTVMMSGSVGAESGTPGTPVTVEGETDTARARVVVVFESQTDETRLQVGETQTAAAGNLDRFTFVAEFAVPGTLPNDSYNVLASANGGREMNVGTFIITGSVDRPTRREENPTPTTLPPIQKEEPATENTPGTGGAVNSSPQQTATNEEPSSRSLGGSATAPQRPAATGRTAQPSVAGGAPAVAAPNAVTTEAMPAPALAPEASPAPLPSPRSATDQLWSGFSEGPRRSVNGRSLTDPVPAADGGGMTAGLVLLTLGLLALGSAFGVATVRRRRAPAPTR